MENLRSITPGWGGQWETLANAITDYYGGGISSIQYQSVVNMLNSGEYTMEEMESILSQIPEFSRTYNANGELVRVSYNATNYGNTAAGGVANAINSNAANATNSQFSTVQSITKDAQTGKVTISDTVKKYNSGVASNAKAIAGSAVAAVGATAVGISLAKVIDSTLYNANPDFWNERGMQSLNPETWASITAGENDFGSNLFNFVFQIDDTTGNPTAYLDEKTFAYMTAYMVDKGVFGNGHSASDPDVGPGSIAQPINFGVPENYTIITGNDQVWTFETVSGDVSACSLQRPDTNPPQPYVLFASDDPDAVVQRYINGEPFGTYTLNLDYTYDNETVYYVFVSASNGSVVPDNNTYTGTPTSFGSDAWVMIYGDIGPGSNIGGITDQTGQTQFDASGIDDPTDIDDVLSALQTQFSDLWDNRIEFSPDGDTVVKYIPVGFPTGGNGIQPITTGATKTDLSPDISGDGENSTDSLIKTLIDMIQNPLSQDGVEGDTTTPTLPTNPNPNDMGAGNTPAIVLPSGSTSALYSIYNPTQAEINSFGAWLWSPNFVDQLLKLFNDPMQAIIGLHKVFATPVVSGTGNIKVGYLDSGVSSNLVSDQYTEIDCGKVNLSEYFGNTLDYTDTDIYLYLPFIGIISLSTVDVIRSEIEVIYKVDVVTGACLASVNVYRDSNAGGQLYTYAGNCAVQYPLSSGSYMGIVTGLLGVAGSIVGTMASGGAMLPMALGIGASALHGAKTNVQHSGSVSGSAGAMGIKKPYLIIRRPQTKIADNFRIFNGQSENVFDVLGNYSGYTRVKYVNLENIAATGEELTEIENILKDGAII